MFYVQNAQCAVHASLSHQPPESSLRPGLYAPVTVQRSVYLLGEGQTKVGVP